MVFRTLKRPLESESTLRLYREQGKVKHPTAKEPCMSEQKVCTYFMRYTRANHKKLPNNQVSTQFILKNKKTQK